MNTSFSYKFQTIWSVNLTLLDSHQLKVDAVQIKQMHFECLEAGKHYVLLS